MSPQATRKTTMNYPQAPEIAETVTIGELPFTDVYRWLAEDTPETLQWQQAQDELAQATLRKGGHVPAFEALLQPVFTNMLEFHAPQPQGGRWFHRITPAGTAHPIVTVSDRPDAPGRVLFELARMGGKSALLHVVMPSADGSRLLVTAGLADVEHAQHRVTAFVIDTASGEILHRFTREDRFMGMAWLPDNSGFLYAAVPAPQDGDADELPPAPGLRIYEQQFDAACTSRLVPLAHAHPFVMPMVSADQRYAFIGESQVALHPTWIRRLVPGAAWEPFLDASFGRVKGTVIGDEFIAIHNDADTPTGRLVAIPLSNPRERKAWRELLPAGESTLASVTPAAGKLVLADMHGGFSRLRVLALDGTVEREVPLPGQGAIGKMGLGFILGIVDDLVWVDGDDVSFVYSSLQQTPASYRYDMRSGALQAVGEPPRILAADLTTLEARAADGQPVVYRVLRPKGRHGAGPTIVTGYGGFNVPSLPCWSAMAGAWVEAGGTWVHAHLRGGGEFGEAFWQAGRMARKANTFEDLFGVLRDVVGRGITTVEQLGVQGSSNGGLLVAAAIAEHPELFAAGVPQVPVVDVHDLVRDPFTLGIVAADYGNPMLPEEAQWMASWSPYRRLRRGARFPAVLIDSSANDLNCPPWHGRKLAAFLQNQGAKDSGVALLRVRADAGHNEMTQAQFIQRDAEELAFFAEQLGLPASI